MFPEMRRQDRMMAEEDAFAILQKGLYGTFNTVDEDGYPYGTPFGYVVDLDKRCLYIHCALNGSTTLAHITEHKEASFSYIGKTKLLPEEFVFNYCSVMVFGKARAVQDEAEKRDVLKLFISKYSSSVMEAGLEHIEKEMSATGIIALEIEHITGKKRS